MLRLVLAVAVVPVVRLLLARPTVARLLAHSFCTCFRSPSRAKQSKEPMSGGRGKYALSSSPSRTSNRACMTRPALLLGMISSTYTVFRYFLTATMSGVRETLVPPSSSSASSSFTLVISSRERVARQSITVWAALMKVSLRGPSLWVSWMAFLVTGASNLVSAQSRLCKLSVPVAAEYCVR